uniref:RNA recognition motif-containing family protein n=1 Tax=Rhizophora mucronata TaxID=61149 RepID=A0A2P2MP50_RHIMU
MMAPITPVFTFLIPSLPHLMFLLQLLHKMIYIPSLSFLPFLWSFFLPLLLRFLSFGCHRGR